MFDRLIAAHGADRGVRRPTTKDQFVALLYGQLSGASGLREIIVGLEGHAAWLYHLESPPVQRSTLADANVLRPSVAFTELIAETVKRALMACGARSPRPRIPSIRRAFV